MFPEVVLVLKNGVDFSLLCAKFLQTISLAVMATAPLTVDGAVVVTSCHNEPGIARLAREGSAVDFRYRGNRTGAILAADQYALAFAWTTLLRQRLGPGYDVVLESDHIHVERDDDGA